MICFPKCRNFSTIKIKFKSVLLGKIVFLLNAAFPNGNSGFTFTCQIAEIFHILLMFLIYLNQYRGRLSWDSHHLSFCHIHFRSIKFFTFNWSSHYYGLNSSFLCYLTTLFQLLHLCIWYTACSQTSSTAVGNTVGNSTAAPNVLVSKGYPNENVIHSVLKYTAFRE
jgi:hypothetical protein